MDKIKAILKKMEASAPAAFLALCLLSFGLLIPRLGFYMDDWPYVFYANLKGIDSLREMLVYDSRPNAVCAAALSSISTLRGRSGWAEVSTA